MVGEVFGSQNSPRKLENSRKFLSDLSATLIFDPKLPYLWIQTLKFFCFFFFLQIVIKIRTLELIISVSMILSQDSLLFLLRRLKPSVSEELLTILAP